VEGEVERERREWRKAQAERAVARREKRTVLVHEFVQDLVSFALRIADFRERTDHLVPKKEYNDWLSLLVAGDVNLCEPMATGDDGSIVVDDVVDSSALHDYLHSQGEWVSAEHIGFNEVLGQAVHMVRTHAQPPLHVGRVVLSLPVRMAIIGGPFTGKTTLARTLAKAYNTTVLQPEALISAAIASAISYTAPEAQVGPMRGTLVCHVHDEYHSLASM
jgi:hypothetical protein